jgi:hypothetical protein
MGDYKLTAGQQQQLTDFLNAGKSIYIEGNDFGYFQAATAFYKMFGAQYLGDGNSTGNVSTLTGERNTLIDRSVMKYTYGSAYPDQWVDFIGSNGCDIMNLCQTKKGRLACYAGPSGTYRTIYSTTWFGAMKNAGSSHTKNEIMAAYMRYLKGDSLVVALADDIPASTGAVISMFLESPVAEGGRNYAVLGSVTGTNPGIPVGPVVLPLNYDSFMEMVIFKWNTTAFSNFLGDLDASGRAVASLNTLGPVDPSLVGYSLYFAFLLTDPIDTASNAVEIPIN